MNRAVLTHGLLKPTTKAIRSLQKARYISASHGHTAVTAARLALNLVSILLVSLRRHGRWHGQRLAHAVSLLSTGIGKPR